MMNHATILLLVLPPILFGSAREPRYAAASQARVVCEELGGVIVCRVDVERAGTPVYVDRQDYYVRLNNITQKLGTPQALEHIRARRLG